MCVRACVYTKVRCEAPVLSIVTTEESNGILGQTFTMELMRMADTRSEFLGRVLPFPGL